jgi:sulfite exporter TauE/SafE
MVEEILNQIGELAPMFVLGLGLAIGLEHAFEADHIAAVSTQVSKRKYSKKSTTQLIKESVTKSSLLGAFWGAGHTTTLVLIGFLAYALTITIQEQIFSGFEFVVGVMLVFLGITTVLNKKFFKLKHKHPHQHTDETIHFHEHEHNDADHRHGHKSYVIGLIHGLAGSGSLVVLTAATLDNVSMVLGFILIFGIGSILGMVLVSGLMGLPLVLANQTTIIQKIFRYVAGTFSLLIGANIMYEIVFIEKLFIF